jgi:transposase-like protein
VLVAIGVGPDGHRHILGVAEDQKEDLEGWRGFLRHRRDCDTSRARSGASGAI